MIRKILGAALLAAAFAAPAPAADTSSLSAFVASCSSDAKSCQAITHDLIVSATNANYGCVPKALSPDDAGNKLFDWMKTAADPKYATMALEDVMWAGVDELWPCKK